MSGLTLRQRFIKTWQKLQKIRNTPHFSWYCVCHVLLWNPVRVVSYGADFAPEFLYQQLCLNYALKPTPKT
ncbi:hypothetical protein KsCSTR_03100 [Candidatus Kuenenia stuttgartiensis]|uniref:Uncharacterized protein n=1 Tax=Kuenenia stuttgartiensis TaxID=174633 RepID=Q1PY11_KUEST|nr:hypothetical protein KsCSTR_03100 [Candidatus Kuenenia stuttgartiensis]CAJ72921.1 unknown protein [Candidatus Kuenenia stuttgartiensis]